MHGATSCRLAARRPGTRAPAPTKTRRQYQTSKISSSASLVALLLDRHANAGAAQTQPGVGGSQLYGGRCRASERTREGRRPAAIQQHGNTYAELAGA